MSRRALATCDYCGGSGRRDRRDYPGEGLGDRRRDEDCLFLCSFHRKERALARVTDGASARAPRELGPLPPDVLAACGVTPRGPERRPA